MQQATGNQSHFLDGRVIRPHRARRERTGSLSRLHRRKSEQSRVQAAGVLVADPRCPYGVTQTGLSASLSLSLSLSLRFCHDFLGFDETIGVDRDRIDAALNQECREFRIITRRLAADANFAVDLVGLANDLAHNNFNRFIPLVEQLSQPGRITIHAEHKLREVIAADGKAVETFTKFFGEDDVRWYFAHHIYLQPATAAHEAVRRELTEDFVGFAEGATERHHHDHVFQPDLIAHTLDRLALQLEGVAKFFVVITRGAAQSEHRVLLVLFKLFAPNERGVFIGLEIAQPYDDGTRMLRGSDRGNALCEFVDEIIALVLVTANQFVDALARVAILQLVEMRQRHRMNLNAIGDDELDARQADAVARQFPPTKRAARAGDIEHDRRARFWQLLQADFLLGEIEQSVVNKAFVALSAGERHLLAIAQNFCRLTCADDCRNAKLAADDRCVTGSPAQVSDDAFGFFEDRTPIGIGHFGN